MSQLPAASGGNNSTKPLPLEGVRVIVPPSDTDATARYMEQGFREAPMFDENGALIWHPAYRPY